MFARAETAPDEVPGSLRFFETDTAGKLQVAKITLENSGGVTIDLVGAVHIADKKYFDDLNKQFTAYDSVLFEMIGGDGDMTENLKESKARKDDPIRFFQVLLKNTLELEYQLEGIDYTAENFTHADMTIEEFKKSQEDSGETLQSFFERALKAQVSVAEEKKDGDGPLANIGALMGIFSGDADAGAIKLGVGRQLGSVDTLIEKIEGEDGSVILTGRNQAAIRKLREILAGGGKNVAIFYGAAHLPRMEAQIISELGFKRVRAEWLTAWDIVKPEGKTTLENEKPAA